MCLEVNKLFSGLINGVCTTFFLSCYKGLQLITMQPGTPLAVQCSSSRTYC